MEDCIFCKIVSGEIPSLKVYENDHVLAFEDINPVSSGHTLIIPKNHVENIWEISPEDVSAVHLAARKIALAIKESLAATGMALLLYPQALPRLRCDTRPWFAYWSSHRDTGPVTASEAPRPGRDDVASKSARRWSFRETTWATRG